jgi:hypothetical protein
MNTKIERVIKRLDMLKKAKYIYSSGLYKIRDEEYITKEARKMEIDELKLKLERMKTRDKWLKGGNDNVDQEWK